MGAGAARAGSRGLRGRADGVRAGSRAGRRGIDCVVAAPSKLPRPAGERVKTDARELLLARLLRLGEITPVRVPTIEQETARDLVRAREDVRGDLMRARHRLSKLLLRHGMVYSGGRAWTGAHDVWLRARAGALSSPALRLAFDADYEAVAGDAIVAQMVSWSTAFVPLLMMATPRSRSG